MTTKKQQIWQKMQEYAINSRVKNRVEVCKLSFKEKSTLPGEGSWTFQNT